METRFSLSLKQLALLVLLTVFVAVGLTVLVFLAGQGNGFNLFAIASTSTPTLTPTMPPLPKAMTATPAPRLSQMYVLTEEQVNAMVGEYTQDAAPMAIHTIRIRAGGVQVIGDIDYGGYQGVLDISGAPFVQNLRMRFRLDQVTLDGQSLPAFLYPTIEEQINLFFDQLLSGYDIETVELQDGQIQIMFVPW
jgi:hypothetical protein